MLFLGAGASAAFGIPTLQELTTECETVLKKGGFPTQEFEQIRASLTRFGIVPDFEAIFTVLQSLATIDSSIRTSGPLAAYLAHRIREELPEKRNIGSHVTELKRMLVEKCSAVRIDDAVKHYNRLFETFQKTPHSNIGPNSSTGLVGGSILVGPPVRRTQDIFTLNYDLVIEKYFDVERVANQLKTGFTPSGMRMFWNPREGYEWDTQRSFTNLVKLHGSVDQVFTTQGIEKRQAPPDVGYYTTSRLDDMLVFPVHEKYVTLSPYFEMYALLRERLRMEPICVVVGYSFRDEAVNNAFIDAIHDNPRLKIIYIGGRNGDRNLAGVPQIAAKTLPINALFGVEEHFYVELENGIKSWYGQLVRASQIELRLYLV
jgi:hypothetical protein